MARLRQTNITCITGYLDTSVANKLEYRRTAGWPVGANFPLVTLVTLVPLLANIAGIALITLRPGITGIALVTCGPTGPGEFRVICRSSSSHRRLGSPTIGVLATDGDDHGPEYRGSSPRARRV